MHAFPQNFCTRKLGEIVVLYTVLDDWFDSEYASMLIFTLEQICSRFRGSHSDGSQKKLFWNILPNSQESTYARVSFLIR